MWYDTLPSIYSLIYSTLLTLSLPCVCHAFYVRGMCVLCEFPPRIGICARNTICRDSVLLTQAAHNVLLKAHNAMLAARNVLHGNSILCAVNSTLCADQYRDGMHTQCVFCVCYVRYVCVLYVRVICGLCLCYVRVMWVLCSCYVCAVCVSTNKVL